jgi:hypothetical protein
MMRFFSTFLAAAVSASCSLSTVSGPTPLVGDGKRVLFIGNSLTYYNELPLMVQALADSAGGERLAVASVTYPDFALEDHWGQGDALKAIRQGGWAYVVMQQGPSSLAESRTNLREWGGKFAAEIAKIGAKPVYYSVWPQGNRQQDFDRATESYALAAGDVDGLLVAAGEAWRATWRLDPTIELYAFDGLHPNVAGSYVAAAAIYGVLLGKSPVGLPRRIVLRSGAGIQVDAKNLEHLQRGAAEAITKFGPKKPS